MSEGTCFAFTMPGNKLVAAQLQGSVLRDLDTAV